MSFKFSFSNVRKLISSGLDECPIASVKATRDQSCQLSRFRTHATYPITHATKKKNTILGQVRYFSNS